MPLHWHRATTAGSAKRQHADLPKPRSRSSAMNILYKASATSTGGRDGRAVSSDNALDVKLAAPRELGGNGAAGTIPEQLFAAGYSACFLSAMKFVAGQHKQTLPADPQVTAEV